MRGSLGLHALAFGVTAMLSGAGVHHVAVWHLGIFDAALGRSFSFQLGCYLWCALALLGTLVYTGLLWLVSEMIPKFYGTWGSSVVAALVVSTACALILAVR
jgi:hypothetical protein